LRSKAIYIDERIEKSRPAGLPQLEEILKHRDKKLGDNDKTYRNLESEKEIAWSLSFRTQRRRGERLENKVKFAERRDGRKKIKKWLKRRGYIIRIPRVPKKELDLRIQAVERSQEDPRRKDSAAQHRTRREE